jgi:hypothetical protein
MACSAVSAHVSATPSLQLSPTLPMSRTTDEAHNQCMALTRGAKHQTGASIRADLRGYRKHCTPTTSLMRRSRQPSEWGGEKKAKPQLSGKGG